MVEWRVDGGPAVAGRHYPRTPSEFEAWVPNERAARAYLTAVRFRASRSCHKCGVELVLGGPRGTWCQACRRHVSLTTGTLMQGTRLPMKTWLAACWNITQTKVGMSATGFADSYGLSYTSTWLLFHKIRYAMEQTGREKLSGHIEIDETWVGGHEVGGRGKGSARKSVVIAACEFNPYGAIGRARLERAHSAGILSLKAFIRTHIEPGSILFSDGAASYITAVNDLHAEGLTYKLNQTNQQTTTLAPDEVLHRVHRVISLFKRQHLGTFQGGIGPQHLDAYLDEWVFRFNRRKSRNRGLLFWRLVTGITDTSGPLRYIDLRGAKAELAVAARKHKALEHQRMLDERSALNHHQYERRKAAKGGEPEPAPRGQLDPSLRHEEPLDPF